MQNDAYKKSSPTFETFLPLSVNRFSFAPSEINYETIYRRKRSEKNLRLLKNVLLSTFYSKWKVISGADLADDCHESHCSY